MPLNPLNHHYAMENPASVYDEEAMTALELAGRTMAKVNETVNAFNELEAETNQHLENQDQVIQTMNDKTMPAKVTAEVQRKIDSGEFDQAINEYAGDLTGRVNNLIGSVSPGTTTMDAEVIDTRVGANGEKYTLAGEAVRDQIGDLRAYYDKPNLIDHIEYGYIKSDGWWASSIPENHELTSDFIPVTPGVPYTFSINHHTRESMTNNANGVPSGWYAFNLYDENKTFIQRKEYGFSDTNFSAHTITFESGVSYVRVTWRNYVCTTVKFEQSTYATVHKPYWSNNLINLNVVGYYTATGGFNKSSNELLAQRDERLSLPVPVEPGEVVTFYNGATDVNSWSAYCLWSETGTILERVSIEGRTMNLVKITIPDNARYISFCCRAAFVDYFSAFRECAVWEKTADQLIREMTMVTSYPTANTEPTKIKGIAHRGSNTVAPENTMQAFKQAKIDGFNYVECDVEFTADNIPVLLHDETIDRTSTGSGNIASMTLEQARQFDYGYPDKFGDKYSGTQLPTFSEFIWFCKSVGLHPYIEIKSPVTEAEVNTLFNIVNDYGMCGNVTWISFSFSALRQLSDLDHQARLGFLVPNVSIDTVTFAGNIASKGNNVFIDSASYTYEEVQLCKEAGLPLEVWVVNDAETIKTGLDPYISGVTSDSYIAEKIMSEYAMSIL